MHGRDAWVLSNYELMFNKKNKKNEKNIYNNFNDYSSRNLF